MDKARISVVMPAKNEAGPIEKVIDSVRQLVPEAEILIVDDGSTDETARIAADAGARLVSHRYSMGNGAAIKSGARAATGDIIVFMDADGQHNPGDIPRLLGVIAEG